MSIEEKVLKIFENVLQIKVNLEDVLNEITYQSIDSINILCDIEEEFSIPIDILDITSFKTVRDVVEYVIKMEKTKEKYEKS